MLWQPYRRTKENSQMSQNKPNDSLTHSKWRCQYHVVFAPKYRRRVIYGKIKADIGKMSRKLCAYK